jgi:hypothetical protein
MNAVRRAVVSRRIGARLVLNEGQHCSGLLPALERLSQILPDGTITTGSVRPLHRRLPASGLGLVLQDGKSVPNSYTLIAREGEKFQEVTVSTSVDPTTLRRAASFCARLAAEATSDAAAPENAEELGWDGLSPSGVAGAGSKGARLVLNHSTHCEGLLPVLSHLSRALPDGCIVPSHIARCRAASFRGFRLRLQPSLTSSGGYRLLARRGTTVQEVVVSTSADRTALSIAVHLAAHEVHPSGR